MTDAVAPPESLTDAIRIVHETVSLPLLDRLRRLGFRPEQGDLAGHDWRECSFAGYDLRGIDLSHTRLWKADFDGAIIDERTNFTGAVDVHRTNLWRAVGWRKAKYDPHAFAMLEAEARRRGFGNPAKTRTVIDSTDSHRRISGLIFEMQRTATFEEAKALLDRITMENGGPHLIAYTILMKVSRFKTREVFEDFVAANGKPDIAMMTALLNAAYDPEVVDRIERQVDEYDLVRDKHYYTSLVAKQANLNNGLKVIERMRAADVKVNEFTAFALFDVTFLMGDAVRALIAMHRAGVQVFTWPMLLELKDRSPDTKLTDWNIRAMREDNRSPKEIVLELIIRCFYGRWRREFLDALGLDPQ